MDEFQNSTSKIAIEIRTIAFRAATFKPGKRVNVSLLFTVQNTKILLQHITYLFLPILH